MTRPDPLVDFLVAGVQKGGTTALYEHLLGRPDIAMAAQKEVHFFDDDALDWRGPDYAGYHAQFPSFDGRARGEATPIYLYWPNCLQRIAQYNPNMKLILVFRNPIDRAWSHWRMEAARHFDAADFSWAIREGRARQYGRTASGHHRVFSYVERGFYGEQLADALSHFPPSQLLMLRSEDLMADPTKSVGAVLGFLGVSLPQSPLTAKIVNVGRSVDGRAAMPEADRLYLADIYADDLKRFEALSGLDVSHWLGHDDGRRALP